MQPRNERSQEEREGERERARERESESEAERGKRQSERARNPATLASSEGGKRPGISLGPFLRVDVLTREPLVLSQRKALNRSTHWKHPQLWFTTMLGKYLLWQVRTATGSS
jgi:hypothetical protein